MFSLVLALMYILNALTSNPTPILPQCDFLASLSSPNRRTTKTGFELIERGGRNCGVLGLKAV